ncbi:DUF4194 domain-containing protein [Rhizobium sp. BK176]|uniref:DUF4194 domain-containing protein n=1 Tax=Rhizobium sp. BK176 TaxID=2587071 RepID=UPI0021699399|nr:DUF4194 domain-containing protein [Rhizobium sp. BK176]MCS4090011.1 hypothetical protein [Rhizobium sp. BK176]
MDELREFSQIVDGEWPETPVGAKTPSADELTGAIQVMITRQVIYSHTKGLGGAYEVVNTYGSFFARYFKAMGLRLIVSPRDQMVALSVPQGESRYDAVYERLTKEESLVLLALRLVWEEAMANQDIAEAGVCETTTGDVIDRYKSATQLDPPNEGRLMDILRLFQRRGAVRVGNRDSIEKVTPMSILPGVVVLAPDTFLDDLKLLGAGPSSTMEEPANQNDG